MAQPGEPRPDAGLAGVLDALAQRDRMDSTRATAPLQMAADACALDTTDLTVDEVVRQIVQAVRPSE
jgi:cytidylate kinase